MSGGEDAFTINVGSFGGTLNAAGWGGAISLGGIDGSVLAGESAILVAEGGVNAGATAGSDLAV